MVLNFSGQKKNVYIVGIKGTGTSALAELLCESGCSVSGSDTTESFYTQAILDKLNIPYYEEFDAAHITKDFDLIIHSPAYNEKTNPELAQAQKLNIPVIKYPDALGEWSSCFESAGICGVHGKTTTTAITGTLLRAADIPAQILVGAAVAGFGGRSTLTVGKKYFVAETCEYRSHFLAFHPRHIILTSVESDHQDYFHDYESIRDAFVEYCRLLPAGGTLIYCADDNGASEVAEIIKKENRGTKIIPYGFTANGDYRVTSYNVKDERGIFTIAGFMNSSASAGCGEPIEFKMRIPGRHQALNVAAALALTEVLAQKEYGSKLSQEKLQSIKTALEDFSGSKRRSEIIGTANGILFMDDYGHHPTEIKTTLAGLKSFYPNRRLIVSFMSHTYTRTDALLDEFASCFDSADFLILHKIYSSAREKYEGGINGKTLYERVKAHQGNNDNVCYIHEIDDAFSSLCEMLKPGDIFLTLGAGNNWPLGEKLFTHFGGGQC